MAIQDSKTKLWRAVMVSLGVSVAELIGGIISNSLAVISDAVHDGFDGFGFILSLFFLYVAHKSSTRQLSFGYKRVEILGAIVSVTIIWLINIGIIYEAIVRFQKIINKDPTYRKIDAPIMFALSVFGLSCNIIIMRVLGHGHAHFGVGSHSHSHDHGGSHSHSHDHGGSHSHSHDHGGSHGHSHNVLPAENETHGHTHGSHSHSHGTSEHEHEHPQPETPPYPFSIDVPEYSDDDSMTTNESIGHTTINDVSSAATMTIATEAHHHNHGHSHQGELHGHGHGESGEHEESHEDLIQHSEADMMEPQRTHHHEQEEDINVSSAYAHAVGHVLQDLGVVLASILIWAVPNDPNMQLADPISTVLFSLMGLLPTFPILKVTLRILMQSVPEKYNVLELKTEIESIENVSSCHELHIWSMSVDDHFLSVHIVADENCPSDLGYSISRNVRKRLLLQYGIQHCSVQIEEFGEHCMDLDRSDKECFAYDQSMMNEDSIPVVMQRRSLGSKCAYCMMWMRDYFRGHNRNPVTVSSIVDVVE
jgi:cation diffusion facilitator family transporter